MDNTNPFGFSAVPSPPQTQQQLHQSPLPTIGITLALFLIMIVSAAIGFKGVWQNFVLWIVNQTTEKKTVTTIKKQK
jgi:hypothetical protein